MTTIDSPPAGLRAAGRALWKGVLAEHVCEAGDAALLVSVCKLADECVRMEKELAGSPMVVRGSTGQLAPHPLLRALREHRLAMSKIIESLGLAEDEAPGLARSAAGRRLALRRWQGGGA